MLYICVYLASVPIMCIETVYIFMRISAGIKVFLIFLVNSLGRLMFFLEIFLYIFDLVDAIIPENKIFVCILISFFLTMLIEYLRFVRIIILLIINIIYKTKC